jgi:hypothetical protein
MQFTPLCAVAVAVVIDAPAATPAMAQEPVPATPVATREGEPVVVRTDGPRETLRGRLVSFDETSLTIELPAEAQGGAAAGRRLTLPVTRLRRVDVVKRDPIWNGAVLGAVFLAVCASTWCQQGLDKPSTARDVILAAGMGALVFGGIDALWIERRTIYEAGAGGPRPGGRGARLSFRINF